LGRGKLKLGESLTTNSEWLIMKLKQLIKNELEKDKTLAGKLAEKAGYKNATPIYKFLNEEEREMEDMLALVIIVKELFPDQEEEIMTEYCQTLKPNKKAARYALEYADANHFSKMTDILLGLLSNSTNATSKEWAAVYEVHCKVKSANYTTVDTWDMISNLSIKSPEMKLFSKIILIYKFCQHRRFDLMQEIVDSISEKALDNIASSFIRSSFKCRSYIMQASTYISLNQVEKARELADYVLKNTNIDRFLSFANLHLGNSYIFSDFDKAKAYYTNGLTYAKNVSAMKAPLINSLAFLHNYWGRTHSWSNGDDNQSIPDLHEKAFQLIREGKLDAAKSILNKVAKLSLSDNQKGYHHFYRGLITEDRLEFLTSIKYFKLSGDQYFRNCSLIELKKLGEQEEILEVLAI